MGHLRRRGKKPQGFQFEEGAPFLFLLVKDKTQFQPHLAGYHMTSCQMKGQKQKCSVTLSKPPMLFQLLPTRSPKHREPGTFAGKKVLPQDTETLGPQSCLEEPPVEAHMLWSSKPSVPMFTCVSAAPGATV